MQQCFGCIITIFAVFRDARLRVLWLLKSKSCMLLIVMGLAAVFSDPEAVGEEGQVSVRRDELRANP